LIPTKRFWLAIAIGIPIAAVTTALGVPWLGIIYDVLLFGMAWLTGYLAPSEKNLSVVRTFDPVLSVRVANRVLLRLSNDGPEPIKGVFRDEPPALFEASRKEFPVLLRSGSETELSYSLTPFERGSDYFRGSFMRIACPLGLVDKQVRLNTEQSVRVYPNVLALREFDFLRQKGKLNQLGIRKSRMRGLGSEFESLRDYTEGDDFRKVDWKATARRGKVIVRQFEQERNQPVVICIDIGRRMLSEVHGVTKLDYVLDSLLMLAQAAVLANDFVGLLVYADTVKRYIPPRKGRNQLGFVIDAVHDLLPEPVESDPAGAFSYLSTRWKRRSLLVNFTDIEGPEDAMEFTKAFGPMSRRHLTLLARVADPKMKELTDLSPTDVKELYLKSSALMFSNERKVADSVLTAAGLHSLEAEPQDLAAALVSFYFEVKEKALI
jgi:uncharacterized protein (DUF58 family)